MNSETLIVLTPVYEDRPSARMLIQELTQHLDHFVLVIVEDGSIQDPLQISDLIESGLKGEILYLARNVGHQRAIATGLAHVAEHYPDCNVVVLDSDGEDRPSKIPGLLNKLSETDVDVIVANRGRRKEKLTFRFFYFFYRLFFSLLTGKVIDFGNFVAMKPKAVKRLTKMQELWVHFPAAVIVSKLRVKAVKCDRGLRYVGESKMNFVSLVLHGMRSVMVFAESVLVRLGVLCVIVAALSLFGIALVLVLKYIGMATPGWVTTVAGFLVVIFFQVGILTMITLMITGTVRGSPQVFEIELDQIIDQIETTP